jgi:hypothetical protein
MVCLIYGTQLGPTTHIHWTCNTHTRVLRSQATPPLKHNNSSTGLWQQTAARGTQRGWDVAAEWCSPDDTLLLLRRRLLLLRLLLLLHA